VRVPQDLASPIIAGSNPAVRKKRTPVVLVLPKTAQMAACKSRGIFYSKTVIIRLSRNALQFFQAMQKRPCPKVDTVPSRPMPKDFRIEKETLKSSAAAFA